MKRILIGALSLLLVTGAAQAQDSTRGRQHRKQQTEQLNLSADQKTKLQAMREAQQEERTTLKKQQGSIN